MAAPTRDEVGLATAEGPLSSLFQKTVDALQSHLAILDEDGRILAVNAAWDRYATRNGLGPSLCGPGMNYLGICERADGACSEDANAVARAIREVIRGRLPAFQREYPCHSPDESRWFCVRVTGFEFEGRPRVVITHEDITDRKLAEIRLREANLVLEELATTDALTGLRNRRGFDAALAAEWRRHARSGLPLALILMDVDSFKRYNDALGHPAGDDCLREVAAAIRSAAGRPGDVVARFGGEEFAMLLPETGRVGAGAMAATVAERLRRRALPHPRSDAGPLVTLSLGSASAVPAPGEPPEALVGRADRALYRAKAAGRDAHCHDD